MARPLNLPGGPFCITMSFDDEMISGFAAMDDFAGEEFTVQGRSGCYLTGVFRGDSSDVGFDDLQGHDIDMTNALSVKKHLFSTIPRVDEIIIKSSGEKYNITAVDSSDASTWDLSLKKINDG